MALKLVLQSNPNNITLYAYSIVPPLTSSASTGSSDVTPDSFQG